MVRASTTTMCGTRHLLDADARMRGARARRAARDRRTACHCGSGGAPVCASRCHPRERLPPPRRRRRCGGIARRRARSRCAAQAHRRSGPPWVVTQWRRCGMWYAAHDGDGGPAAHIRRRGFYWHIAVATLLALLVTRAGARHARRPIVAAHAAIPRRGPGSPWGSGIRSSRTLPLGAGGVCTQAGSRGQ